MNNSTDKNKRIEFLENAVRRLLEERSIYENKAIMLENKLNAYLLKDNIFSKDVNNDTILLKQLGILIRPKIHDIKNTLMIIEVIFYKIKKYLETDKTETDLIQVKESLNLGINSIEYIKRSLLDLSYIGGKVPDELTKINIKDLITKNIKYIQDRYKDFRIDLNLQNGLTEILGYRESLDQIINNLTLNAIEACTPSEGLITVTVQEDGKNPHFFNIIVKDNGCGIQKNEIDKIYDLHYTTKKTGFGVGLYLVRSAVELLKGKIMCESIPNKGTTFTVTLPMLQDKN